MPECHVITSTSMFDLSSYLLSSINCDIHGETLSPPPSPQVSPPCGPYPNTLDDLSPLTTPEPTPPSSPRIRSDLFLPPMPQDVPTSPQPQLLSSTGSSTPTTTLSQGPSCPTLPTDTLHDKKTSKKPEHRKKRQRSAQNSWRRDKRTKEREASTAHYQGRKNAHMKHVAPAGAVRSDWKMSEASVAKTAFVGLDDVAGLQRPLKLEDLVGENSRYKFKLVTWEGRTPTALVDASDRVVGILAGHPDDSNWPLLHDQAVEALESSRSRCQVPKGERKHRRGNFPALHCGISHGGGQRAPATLTNSPENTRILDELNNLPFFKRVAGFASSVMSTWAPALHKYYTKTINDLHSNRPSLKRIFASSVFCAASYNLGPRTVCFRHKDFANLPFGFCAVMSIGSFNPIVSGHLILWDLGLVVEFPPGSTILLPSAIVAHSNTCVGKDERRFSFAQYTAGGIFRWVENNCSTSETYLSTLSPEQLEQEEAKNIARWSFGLSLLPTYPPPHIRQRQPPANEV